MKNKIDKLLCLVPLIFIYLLLLFSYSLKAQEVFKTKSISKVSYAEKIYLQLSNTICATGETLWFKAIVTNTLNMPSKRSGILHVELIDFDEKKISSKILKLENGIADGFFDLDEKLPSGRYLIRAYTQWNRNFGEDFIFKQYIDVFAIKPIKRPDVITDIVLTETNDDKLKIAVKIHPEVLKSDYNKDLNIYILSEEFKDSVEVKRVDKQYAFEYTLPKDLIKVQLKVKLEDTKLKNFKRKIESTYSKTIVLNKDFLDLQFFPEGGKMIAGLTNRIAYKSINYEGLGEAISGHIVDETDSIITPFTTNKLGMGFVYFKPNTDKTYYGKIRRANNAVYKYPLPKAEEHGYTLSLGETSDYMSFITKSNIKTENSLYVKVKSKGVLIRKHAFTLENGIHEALVKKSELPNGIINITLFDDNGLPIAERLFFNLDEKNILNIDVKTDKTIYSQRDKTSLSLTFDNRENEAIATNFSTLVIDKAKLNPNRSEHSNILSYFLLQSELKGFIEKPNTYFDKNNMYRKRDLDALMLTQGWRNYKYSFNDENYTFDIQPETALQVSGKVRSTWNDNKAPKKDVNLILMTSGKSPEVYTHEVDSTGSFSVDLFDPYGDKLDVIIQSSNKKGRAKEYSIKIDAPIPPPKITYEKEEVIALPDSIINDFLKIKKQERQAVTGFDVDDSTVELDAVELTGYKVTPEREKMFKLRGPPDIVIDNEQLKEREEKWMSGLYDLLRTKFPDDIIFRVVQRLDGGSFELAHIASAELTVYYIDGDEVGKGAYSLLPYLTIENVKSVEVLKRPKGGFPNHPNVSIAIVSIYTYGSIGMAALGFSKGIFRGKVSGFSVKREFYSPKYDKLEAKDWDTPDLRPVLHWEPSLFTDKKGDIELEFYNDDSIGDKLIVVEAITSDGKIGYYETSYTVEKRLENN